MSDETVLALTGPGIPPYSARGLRQTLTPITALQAAGGQSTVLRRTVNGELIDLTPTQMRKYASEITGNDQMPPAFGGLWTGQQVTVDCIEELVHPPGGTPERTVVTGSQWTDEDGFVHYRPQLIMLVADFSLDDDEYNVQVGWKLSLLEK